jgi:hypothetical protein
MEKTLRDIYLTYGVDIRHDNGSLRSVVDVLEDIYLNINKDKFEEIEDEIFSTERVSGSVFEKERERGL